MPRYRCATCGKVFDPEKSEICPKCGTIVAPSVLTQIERKQTAARLRADARDNSDAHCHEDDAWLGSSAAQAHRAKTAAWHENAAQINDPYNAASAQRGQAAPNPQAPVQNVTRPSSNRKQKKPIPLILLILIPFFIIMLVNVLRGIFQILGTVFGDGSYFFP